MRENWGFFSCGRLHCILVEYTLHFKALMNHEIFDIAYAALNRAQHLESAAQELRDRALLSLAPLVRVVAARAAAYDLPGMRSLQPVFSAATLVKVTFDDAEARCTYRLDLSGGLSEYTFHLPMRYFGPNSEAVMALDAAALAADMQQAMAQLRAVSACGEGLAA